MNKKLPYIVTDLDGTVVASEDGSVLNQTAIDVEKYQKQSGYKLTFATGRGDIMCKEIIDVLKIKNPIISYNGALIRDSKTWKVLDVTYIDSQTTYEILSKAYQLGLDIVAYDINKIIVTPISKRYKIWANYNKRAIADKYKVDFVIYHDVLEMALGAKQNDFKAVKLLIDFDEDTNLSQAKNLFSSFSDVIDSTISGEGLLDAMAKGVSKKQGLIKYANLMKIDPQKVIFFGDNYNDLQIMEFVDTGYAVENAVEPLKQISSQVIDSVDNNGIGKKLMEMVNQNGKS